MPFVLSVSRSERHGFSKQPQACIRLIANEGVEDDAHRGATVQHVYLKRRDPSLPNVCQVHLLAVEKLDVLRTLGFSIEPGQLGENVLTSGVDLLALPCGTLLHLGPEAVVEVTGLRTPCSQIDQFRPGLQQHMWGERGTTGQRSRQAGIMSIVRSGGLVHPQDAIRVELPPEPHVALGPV